MPTNSSEDTRQSIDEILKRRRARSKDVPLRRGRDDPGELTGPEFLFLLAKQLKGVDLPEL